MGTSLSSNSISTTKDKTQIKASFKFKAINCSESLNLFNSRYQRAQKA